MQTFLFYNLRSIFDRYVGQRQNYKQKQAKPTWEFYAKIS